MITPQQIFVRTQSSFPPFPMRRSHHFPLRIPPLVISGLENVQLLTQVSCVYVLVILLRRHPFPPVSFVLLLSLRSS
jgi:hypothetical protein